MRYSRQSCALPSQLRSSGECRDPSLGAARVRERLRCLRMTIPNSWIGILLRPVFSPAGAGPVPTLTHGSRRGPHSYAAPRLEAANATYGWDSSNTGFGPIFTGPETAVVCLSNSRILLKAGFGV